MDDNTEHTVETTQTRDTAVESTSGHPHAPEREASSVDDREGWYVVTGANAGMGQALTRALAARGKRVVMACRNRERSLPVRDRIIAETGNPDIRLETLDLASFGSILALATKLEAEGLSIQTLVNNAGVMNGEFRTTAEGLEQTVGVNYVGTWLLTRLLLRHMTSGSRIVNTLSCTWRIGRIDGQILQPDPAHYTRFGAYSSSKLALLLFTLELADRLKAQQIGVWGADPGVVSTGMISMGRWFDPLADRIFRPLIRTPEQGADTALWLALGGAEVGTGPYFASRHPKKLPRKMTEYPCRQTLWEETERMIRTKTGLQDI